MMVCPGSAAIFAAQGGSIVNIASVAAFNASARNASYAASKAALVSYTSTLAHAHGPEGVRANTVAPGWVRTPMSSPAPCSSPMAAAARRRRTGPSDVERRRPCPFRAGQNRLPPAHHRGEPFAAADIPKPNSLRLTLVQRRCSSASLLSGGERQMLIVARALHGRPKVILIDE
jgi:NAD(P)-dependent dehydrogenase (short-subunit alcohol dehydrogenase family)